MGRNSALKARLKQAKKNTKLGKKLRAHTRDIQKGKKLG